MIKHKPQVELVWKTYDDWKAAGFQVMKGEKGSPAKRKDSKPLFSNKQVKPAGRGTGDYEHYGDSLDAYDRMDMPESHW